MFQRTLVVALVALVFSAGLVPVKAADPVALLSERADEKRGDAQDDPEGFVADHASGDGAKREADWTVSYACFTAREAGKQAGLEHPDLGVCPAFDDVQEEDDLEEAVDDAVAEELGPVDEAAALGDDAVATADRIVRDPGNALGEVLAFLDRSVRAVERIVDGVLGAAVGIALSGNALALKAGSATLDGFVFLAKTPVRTGTWAAGASADAAAGVVAVAASTSGSATRLVDTGMDAVGDAGRFMVDTVQQAASSLFGRAEPMRESTPVDETPWLPVDDTRDDLLGELEETVSAL